MCLLLLAGCVGVEQQREQTRDWFDNQVLSDHRNYYSPDQLRWLAAGLAGGAVVANTPLDEHVQDWYQTDVRSARTDDVAAVAKELGEGRYVLPTVAAAVLVGHCWPDAQPESTVGQWGDQALRAYMVGTPPMLFLQVATGASRPGETSAGSDWVPFSDNNGVSGHAFMGAVPFITAAKMTDDPRLRATLYAASTLTAWSRVNDDAHYLSQAFLGWCMAELACAAVERTEQRQGSYQLVPLATPDGGGVGLVWQL